MTMAVGCLTVCKGHLQLIGQSIKLKTKIPSNILAIGIETLCLVEFTQSGIDAGIPISSPDLGFLLENRKSKGGGVHATETFNTIWIERPTTENVIRLAAPDFELVECDVVVKLNIRYSSRVVTYGKNHKGGYQRDRKKYRVQPFTMVFPFICGLHQALNWMDASVTGATSTPPSTRGLEEQRSIAPSRTPSAGLEMLRIWNKNPRQMELMCSGVRQDIITSSWFGSSRDFMLFGPPTAMKGCKVTLGMKSAQCRPVDRHIQKV
ncbi:hypothetical protein DFH07DRAFT_765787 [Mycena maculata]|uniref:Uncharacterized protein n=1 Tax=Mycena maculata TaxID=230809 RepID=A0AAD7K973_9AGAR|nr:hypothetical protein DFH07DRAFT_765787 [Mycena maculata]